MKKHLVTITTLALAFSGSSFAQSAVGGAATGTRATTDLHDNANTSGEMNNDSHTVSPTRGNNTAGGLNQSSGQGYGQGMGQGSSQGNGADTGSSMSTTHSSRTTTSKRTATHRPQSDTPNSGTSQQ